MFNKVFFLISITLFATIQPISYWDWSNKNTLSIDFPSHFQFGASIFSNEVIKCDHWNHRIEDIQHMKEVGLTTCLFSIDWPKVEPSSGEFNQKLLQEYADFCDALNENNIQPVILLKNYPDPIWFLALGGFEKEENSKIFERYCLKVFESLQGKAYTFITFWAPESYAMLSYWTKSHAPYKKNMKLAMNVLQNMLNAHVRVYRKLKIADSEKKIKIGITKHVIQLEPKYPWDKYACSVANELTNKPFYSFFTKGKVNISVMLPSRWGGIRKHYRNPLAPHSIDFIGIDYHCHYQMRNCKRIPFNNEPATDIKSVTVYPEGLYYAIKEISEKISQPLNIPIMITKNGIATKDDSLRTLYNERYLYAVSQAMKEGHKVDGYYYYSLLDGYSWGSYDNQFGLFSINYDTLERTLKPGAQRFVEIAQQHKNKI